MSTTLKITTLLSVLAYASCAPTPSNAVAVHKTYRIEVGTKLNGSTPSFAIQQKLAAVVVTKSNDLTGWAERKFALSQAPDDAKGGSATPISHDGYFLTASHVISGCRGKYIYVVYSGAGLVSINRARVIWNSPVADLALLHVPVKTPYYYKWSSGRQQLGVGKMIYNGGMRWKTNFSGNSNDRANGSIIYGWVGSNREANKGRLCSSVQSNGLIGDSQKFNMNLRLLPGDSGGPIVDSTGNLVGINSAVQVRGSGNNTTFVNSIGVRPSLSRINQLMQSDRL